MENAISLQEITKVFGNRKVLDNITLDVKKGEIFGLLGPSGAGKTTLIKILTGQLKAESGSSVINGLDSRKLTGRDYRSFGIMMDDFGVYERLSCFDNLKIFARIYGIGNDKIHGALEAVGLADAKKTPAANLSKGMRSRLRLARVFMIDPEVLFLDEPTSGLDPATADEIQKMILAEKEKGKTVFLTTHTMSEAEKLCDHIALLNEGRIIEYGAPDEICRRYNHKKKITIHLTDGTDLQIPQNEAAADTVAQLLRSGKAETIHTTEPNLEAVFMELTGKELEK
jgi:ABC-2 type transport system ATP-binding protein